jgi:hypothetical protein
MKRKLAALKIVMIALGTIFAVISCTSNSKASGAPSPQSTALKTNEPHYRGDGGKGVVIAVLSPVMQNAVADNWMPQLFQDLITGDLARYSAMTVLDRLNEKLVLAEQNLSVSGNYSDNDYIRLGNLTNAQFIVAGNIQNISGRYNVSFRVNNTETNEIKASFNKPYPVTDIESGLAAKEAVRELLAGMGIELTEAGEQSLLTIQRIDVRATTQLAKGNQAIKTGNEVEAVAFFTEALASNNTRAEADRNIQSVFNTSIGTSIRERANYAIVQKEKWEKIFSDLEIYMRENSPLFIYDFSVVEDKIDLRSNRVTLTFKPGIKVIPNRNALLTYKTIMDNWEQIRNQNENKEWVKDVSGYYRARSGFFDETGGGINAIYFRYCVWDIGLFDNYGDRIARLSGTDQFTPLTVGYESVGGDMRFTQVLAQQKYYDNKAFKPVSFTISLDKVTDNLTAKIEKTYLRSNSWGRNNKNLPAVDFHVMTVVEWQTWLSLQGNAR